MVKALKIKNPAEKTNINPMYLTLKRLISVQISIADMANPTFIPVSQNRASLLLN